MRMFDLEPLGVSVRFTRPRATPDKKRAYLDHSHSHFELHIIKEGCCTFSSMGKRFNVTAGQMCLFAPGVVHSPRPGNPDAKRFCVELEYLDVKGKNSQWLRRHGREHPVWVGEGTALLSAARELLVEQNTSDTLSAMAEQSLLTLLVVRLARALEDQTAGGVVRKREDMRMLHIDQFMNESFALAAGEETLARALNLSRRQLNRVIQKQYGMSFRQKRSQVRLTAARDLLRSTDLPISAIAEDLGYSSSSNFAVFFKSMEGMTPGEYRKQGENIDDET